MASSRTSWTYCRPGSAVALLGLLVAAGATGAASAAVRAPQSRAEEAGPGGPGGSLPLTLLVLRAVGAAGGPPVVADSAVVGLESAGLAAGPTSDELDAFKSAVADVAASPRASSFRAASEAGVPGDLGDPVYLRAAKRQVRYHQCYFNPISCFG